MVRAKTSTPTPAGTRSRSSSPSTASKIKFKAASVRNNKSSRSPSPATAVSNEKPGQSELLSREKSLRFRKPQADNGLKGVAKSGNAKKTVALIAKVSAVKLETIQTVKKNLTVTLTKTAAPTATTTQKTDKKAVANGKLDKTTKGVSDVAVTTRHRIQLDFEDSEESENDEGLKKAVADIEKNLSCSEERLTSGRKVSSVEVGNGQLVDGSNRKAIVKKKKKKRKKAKKVKSTLVTPNKQEEKEEDDVKDNATVKAAAITVAEKEEEDTKPKEDLSHRADEEVVSVQDNVVEIRKIDDDDNSHLANKQDDVTVKSKQESCDEKTESLDSSLDLEDVSDGELDVSSFPESKDDVSTNAVNEELEVTEANKPQSADEAETAAKSNEECLAKATLLLENKRTEEKVGDEQQELREDGETGNEEKQESNQSLPTKSNDVAEEEEENKEKDVEMSESKGNKRKLGDGDVKVMEEDRANPIPKRRLLESGCVDAQSESSSSCSAPEKKLKLDDEQNKSVVVNPEVLEDDKENVDSSGEKSQETVVLLDGAKEAAEDKRPAKKDGEKTYRLSKAELEMLVMSKVTEYFTDGNKSEIGALRRRCEQLEKALEQWRRKANVCQKQVTDLQIVIQRAQMNKKLYMKPSMRSVGLQVQLTRYIPISSDPSKVGINRMVAAAAPKTNMKSIATNPTTVSSSGTTTTIGQKINVSQQMPTNSLFVTSLGSSGALSGKYVASKLGGTGTNAGNLLASRATVATGSVLGTRPISTAKSPSNQVGVSLLHPRSVCPTSQTLVFSSPIVTNAAVALSRTTSLATPMAVTSMHPPLEPNKIVPANSAATPIPMRLVPNQASRSAAAGNTNTTLTPVKSTLVGQPQLAGAVKYIDLAADEEEQSRITKSFTVPKVGSALTVVPSPTGTNSVTVLTPTSTSSGQIITINPSTQNAFTTTASLSMTTPTRLTGSVLASPISTAPMRVAYLMPSTSVVTMVRPNQPMIAGQTPMQRHSQLTALARPSVPTIVLQRGTTLMPIQQNQINPLWPGTNFSNVRPIASTSTVRSVTAAMTSTQVSSLPGIPKVLPNLQTISASSLVPKSFMNIAKVQLTHPAPLPAQPTYPEVPLANRKALPSKPALKISKAPNGIVLSWNMTVITTVHAEISTYQLYAYQEGSAPPSTILWKKVGDVKALPLPMACTLTQFVEGHKYYFAVRAIDVHNRMGPFSDPGSIALAQPMTVKVSKT